MDLLTWAIILFAVGLVLLAGELLLPTHGALGALGLAGIGAGIGCCFAINRWLGLGVFVVCIILSPLVFSLAMKIWPRTPIGKRLMLQHTEKPLDIMPRCVAVGETGVTVTEMRPMGEVEFTDLRIEAVSDRGIIPAGTSVRVMSTDGGRTTVRAI